MIYICLRDDDTNFYTTPSEIKECYGWVLGLFPITLATVPFAHGSERKIMDYDLEKDKYKLLRQWEKNASFEELNEYHKLHPIGDNQELVNFLKDYIKNGTIEIAQHGVNHTYDERGPEMLKDKISFEYIRSGKEYLEKVFNTNVVTFIPPANTIDEQVCKYLKRLNMNLFSSGSIAFSSKRSKLLSSICDLKGTFNKMHDIFSKRKRPIRRRAGIYLFGSVTYNVCDDQKQIIEKLNKSIKDSGFVALGTHYRLLLNNIDYRKKYLEVVEYLSKKDNVKFVTAEEYYKLAMEKYYG